MKKLPIVKIGRKHYFVDMRLKELRNVRDPFDRESIELLHAPKGVTFVRPARNKKSGRMFERIR